MTLSAIPCHICHTITQAKGLLVTMATGINKSERLSKEAQLAARPHHDPHPLPPDHSEVSLSYPGKLAKEDALEPVDLDFSSVSSRKIKRIGSIRPNSFVLCDNYFGLHDLIASQTPAQLIYLDPPYGTGLDFQSRDLQHAYKDNLAPAAYIEYMRRRIILMREVLSDDGSIYVHIGHQMLAHLKVIMDEVFGASNFRNLITRKKCSSKNFTKNQFSNIHDYILFYTKSSRYIWNKPGIAPEKDWIDREYPKLDKKGRYKLVPIHAPGVRNGATGSEWRGMMPPPGKHWQYTPDKLDALDAEGEIHWSKNGNPRRKVYLTKDKMLGLSDYWDQYRDAHHQSIKITGYPTEKNFEMLKMIVNASSNPGDTVVDPFCGSGTTLHAANDLGRKWIGFDQSFTAAKTVIRRMRHGVEAMGDYVNRGTVENSLELFSPNPPSADFSFLVDSWLLSGQEEILQSFWNDTVASCAANSA